LEEALALERSYLHEAGPILHQHHAWEEFVATVKEQHKKSKEAEEGRAASPASAAAAATFIMNNWRHLIPHLSTTNA
jgi:hypothetical protein